MILPACIFTYRGGALLIPACVRLARLAGLIPIVCDDAADPLPSNVRGWLEHEGVERIETTFKRRGNLNGTDCAAGICRALAAAARRHGATHAIKLDDDTVVIRRRVFTRHRHARAVGLTWLEGRPGAYGMAYMLRTDVADAIADRLERLPFLANAPEDMTVWRMARQTGPVIERKFRPQRGPFTHLPAWADPREGIDRFDVMTVGNPPAGGWADRPREIAARLTQIHAHTASSLGS